MSTDFSIKPVGAPVATPVAQPVSDAANNAVATELPASQSVTVADASASVRNDPRRASDLRIASGLSRSRRGLDRLSGRQQQHRSGGAAVSGRRDVAAARLFSHARSDQGPRPRGLLATDRKA